MDDFKPAPGEKEPWEQPDRDLHANTEAEANAPQVPPVPQTPQAPDQANGIPQPVFPTQPAAWTAPANGQGAAPSQAYPTSPAPEMPYPQQAPQGAPYAPGAMPPQQQAYYPNGAAPAGYPAADPAVFQKSHGIHKRIREAEGFCIFIAFINSLLGCAIALLPSFFSDMGYTAGQAVTFIFVGLLFFALALGVHFRSRVCCLIGLIFMCVDTGLTVFSLVSGYSTLAPSSMGGYAVIRILLLLALTFGTIACFQYHSLKKRYAAVPDPSVQVLFARRKLFGSAGAVVKVVLCGIMAVASIGCGVFSIVNQVLTSNAVNWPVYTVEEAGATIALPEGAQITTDSGFVTAEYSDSELYAGFLSIPGYASEDIYGDMGLEAYLRMQLKTQIEDESAAYSTGEMADGTLYVQAYSTAIDGVVSAYRILGYGEDLQFLQYSELGSSVTASFQNKAGVFFDSLTFTE